MRGGAILCRLQCLRLPWDVGRIQRFDELVYRELGGQLKSANGMDLLTDFPLQADWAVD